MALHHPGHRFQIAAAHDGAGGVVGVGHNEELCLVRDLLLQLLLRQAELVFRFGLDDHRHAPRHFRNGHIAHKAGFGDQHLVPGLNQRAHAQVNGLAAAHGHKDLRLGVVFHMVMALHKVGDLRPQLEEPPVGGIAGAAFFQALNARLPNVPGGVEVRLSHRQGDHVVHLVGNVEEFPDARGLDLPRGAVY